MRPGSKCETFVGGRACEDIPKDMTVSSSCKNITVSKRSSGGLGRIRLRAEKNLRTCEVDPRPRGRARSILRLEDVQGRSSASRACKVDPRPRGRARWILGLEDVRAQQAQTQARDLPQRAGAHRHRLSLSRSRQRRTTPRIDHPPPPQTRLDALASALSPEGSLTGALLWE